MDAEFDKLLDSISRENVTLFVGAGLSCSVGLPTGAELAKEIYNLLPFDLQNSIDEEGNMTDLAKVSSAYIYHFGQDRRDDLINFIQQYFEYRYPQNISKTPIGALARIFHFKTIISTNYDHAIEQCYGDNCTVIADNNDVSNGNNRRNKTILIKIHGDFEHRSNMILTTEDYNKLYQGEMNTPIWNFVKNELSTKDILFLGYGYNDGNIDSILNCMERHILNPRKAFLVSKNISLIKKNELNSKKITFFEQDVNEFMKILITRFNKTIINDFQSKKTSYETFCQYTSPYFTPVVEGRHFIYGKPKSSNIGQSIKFTTDKINYSKLTDVDSFEPVELNDIKEFEFTVGDITIPMGKISSIKILRNPTEEYKTTIYFPDVDFEMSNIPTKRFDGNNSVKITYNLAGGEINTIMNFDQNLTNVTFNICSVIDVSVRDQIEWLTLIWNLLKGESFRLTTNKGFSITKRIPIVSEQVKNTYCRLQYMKLLRKIEKQFGITFSGPIEFTEKDFHNVNLICRNIEGNLVPADNDILIEGDLTSETEGAFLVRQAEDKFVCIEKTRTLIDLYGQKVNLGYKMFEIINPEYKNTDITGKKIVTMIAPKGKFRAVYQPLSPTDYFSSND